MRPVIRGPYPINDDGTVFAVSCYKQFKGPLIKRIGAYCSYCEMKLDSNLAVEHVKPKKVDGVIQADRLLDWDNLLLACTNCNSSKGNENIKISEYFWPDIDNTCRPFEYSEGGCITAAQWLSPDMKEKAERTLALTGLDKTPADTTEASDLRWLRRKEAWEIAQLSLSDLRSNNIEAMRVQIVRTMTGHGYWSIWMTVFSGDADMRRRFIQAIAGTDSNCFDASNGYEAVQRTGGAI